ncbi:LLM class flavin-dependent oxidoreductase [Rhodobacter sp. 24-YEA-8]|uniref:LLM class flavin-dependent oxidoreductase n=1 Tax=Rhodobacter sp. 24-YEA-8 TaxID=1884310 RepID=UPI00089B90B4|nr:LLM class flavin-dependent oxidoreductase [Rhodobacter sp. 24-YEA-8]SED18282.1 luciferase-type oxidoreductase, BA3436 family [Rhodobacter sp. 24-YEA-8]
MADPFSIASGVVEVLGGLKGLFGKKPKNPTPRDNLLSQLQGIEEGAEKYGYNRLTLLQHGQTAGTGLGASGPPLAAIWLRDVPLFDPRFGDAGQVFDPFTYMAWLAAKTSRIALTTRSAVVTLRHPIDLAKMATTIDHLSNGRLILGIASGDRPVEFPAYGTRGCVLRGGDISSSSDKPVCASAFKTTIAAAFASSPAS